METFKRLLFSLLRIGSIFTLTFWILILLVDIIGGTFSASNAGWGIFLYSVTWLIPLTIGYSIVFFVSARRKFYKLDVGLLLGLLALELSLIALLSIF